MHPYPGNLDKSQHVYNYRLSRVSRVIEKTFEILVVRSMENFSWLYTR